jgi:hypothetical protein
MKINYVLLSSDENPLYLDFWPIVSKFWLEKFKITPILGLICDEDTSLIKTEYGFVKKFKKIEGVSVGLQSQVVRFFLSKDIDGYCIISDIDMLPLSREYFSNVEDQLTPENIIIYSSNHKECLINNEYPMCYVSAHNKTFEKILEIDGTWIEFVKKLNTRNQGWSTDQKYLFEKVNQHRNNDKNNVLLLEREWNSNPDKRIDRGNWRYVPELVTSGYYIDSHLLRPYNEYKQQINDLINLIN